MLSSYQGHAVTVCLVRHIAPWIPVTQKRYSTSRSLRDSECSQNLVLVISGAFLRPMEDMHDFCKPQKTENQQWYLNTSGGLAEACTLLP